MKIIEVSGKTIPECMVRQLQGLSIEKQLGFFSLEVCEQTTHFISERTLKNPEKYRGNPIEFLDYPLLVQNGIIIGILYYDEKIFCTEYPCSKVRSIDGGRTSSDYWYRDTYHSWVTFRCKLLEQD